MSLSYDSCRDRLVAEIEKPIKEMQLITFDDVLGAAIRPGRANTLHPKTCGDSLLIDFERNFFAVADSPDRNPPASRAFLRKLHAAMVPHVPCREHLDTSENSVETISEKIVNTTNSIIESIEYNNSTTFTGLIIIPIQGVHKVLLLHCGDSLFYHCRIGRMSVEKVTETNHYFVGRVKKLYQTGLFDFYRDSRFLLATDGLNDLFRSLRHGKHKTIEESLLEFLREKSIDQFPELLIRTCDVNPRISDDIGLIAFDPNYPAAPKAATIII